MRDRKVEMMRREEKEEKRGVGEEFMVGVVGRHIKDNKVAFEISALLQVGLTSGEEQTLKISIL